MAEWAVTHKITSWIVNLNMIIQTRMINQWKHGENHDEKKDLGECHNEQKTMELGEHHDEQTTVVLGVHH